jgi:hypothetical protein
VLLQQEKIVKSFKSSRDTTFAINKVVLVATYGAKQEQWAMGQIVNVLGPVTYEVMVDNNVYKRHVNQLLKYKGSVTHPSQSQENTVNLGGCSAIEEITNVNYVFTVTDIPIANDVPNIIDIPNINDVPNVNDVPIVSDTPNVTAPKHVSPTRSSPNHVNTSVPRYPTRIRKPKVIFDV